MLTSKGSKSSNIDIEYHLQAATKHFMQTKPFYATNMCRFCKRLRYFRTVVTPVACFGAGPKAIHGVDLSKLEVHSRKFVRNIVGPPPQTNWDSPWHIIFHVWNEKDNFFVQQSGLPTWTTSCLQQHWRFARYIAYLPANKLVKRVLHWTPMGHATVGRPRIVWESKIQGFCRYKLLGNWLDLAKNDVWIDMTDDFVGFCFSSPVKMKMHMFQLSLVVSLPPAPQRGLAARRSSMKWNEIYSNIFSRILSRILFDIFSGNLSGQISEKKSGLGSIIFSNIFLAFWHFFSFYLAYVLIVFLASCLQYISRFFLALYLACFWHVFWHLFCYSMWHSFWKELCLACILALYLFLSSVLSGILCGTASGIPSDILSRILSGNIPGSYSMCAHWFLELAVEVRQCPLTS